MEEIQELLDTYSRNLPTASYSREITKAADTGATVLLTGSTGNVGSHVLATLLQEPGVRRVYTLNRLSATAKERQRAIFAERGLPVRLLSSDKLVQLFGNATVDQLGIERGAFDEVCLMHAVQLDLYIKTYHFLQLRSNVTHVIHNAWRVDFNLALPSFETHIAGTRRLIDFCASSAHSAKLIFVSSISAAQDWDVSRGSVPEEPLSDPALSVSTGYGSSKFVAENVCHAFLLRGCLLTSVLQLLARAAQCGLSCTSLRVGQVCGSASTGAWGTSEWIPILVKSSIALGKLPELEGVRALYTMTPLLTNICDIRRSRHGSRWTR